MLQVFTNTFRLRPYTLVVRVPVDYSLHRQDQALFKLVLPGRITGGIRNFLNDEVLTHTKNCIHTYQPEQLPRTAPERPEGPELLV
jgi:hypothetical protein